MHDANHSANLSWNSRMGLSLECLILCTDTGPLVKKAMLLLDTFSSCDLQKGLDKLGSHKVHVEGLSH